MLYSVKSTEASDYGEPAAYIHKPFPQFKNSSHCGINTIRREAKGARSLNIVLIPLNIPL